MGQKGLESFSGEGVGVAPDFGLVCTATIRDSDQGEHQCEQHQLRFATDSFDEQQNACFSAAAIIPYGWFDLACWPDREKWLHQTAESPFCTEIQQKKGGRASKSQRNY